MDMTFRPMTPTERMYSYTQSQQLIMQTGCIGHLRADFGGGEQFFSSWDDHREDLKSDAFKQEFDDVINALRIDEKYEAIFKNRGALLSLCARTPEASFGNGREYGFRADSEHYSYMFRLNPGKGEYNIYCYCYLKQWLDRHMKQAEKGIRFITPDYKELFRIADGDRVRYYTPGGEIREPTCRYIDDYHFETSSYGDNLYHICEFAERYTERGCTGIIPIRKSLPEKCVSVHPDSGKLVYLTRGETGYQETNNISLKSTEYRGYADDLNRRSGVSKAQEAAMLAGSMFGWDMPAADPKNYDAGGHLIRPKQKDRGDAR